MKNIEIFGQEILVKDSLCGPTPKSRLEVEPNLRLYVKVTDSCNANCAFCANGTCKDFGNVDLAQLEFVIRYFSTFLPSARQPKSVILILIDSHSVVFYIIIQPPTVISQQLSYMLIKYLD